MTRSGVSSTILQHRSELLAALRHFFWRHAFHEVETPLLAGEVIPELHIEPVRVNYGDSPGWLQASPELHMKRLLSEGMQAIFQVTRSFRGKERGPLHTGEFTIVEWYRTGHDMRAGMELLDQLIQEVAKSPPAKCVSYAEAFQSHVGCCPHTATASELAERADALRIATPDGLRQGDRDEWLNLLLSVQVEPKLGQGAPEILYDYPSSQAALAKVAHREDGPRVAERFELYWQGVELANGYHELTDAVELRQRLTEVNARRAAEGRAVLPLPESLLTAMQQGLPNCAGCALGFDRLAMLVLGKKTLAAVRAFGRE